MQYTRWVDILYCTQYTHVYMSIYSIIRFIFDNDEK